VRERVLQLGLHTAEGWVEVRDGLKAGDILVTRGLEALSDGARVQVVPPAGSASAAPGASAAPPASGSAGGRRGKGGPRSSASAPAPEAP